MKLSIEEGFDIIIGLCLEGFLYGLYSGIFAMYIQDHWASEKGSNKTKSTLFYALCALYVLSVVSVVLDIITFIYAVRMNTSRTAILYISFIQGTVTGCCDFIAQSILIYRCWIVWGYNIRVVIVPSILASVFLVMWLAGNDSLRISSGQLEIIQSGWGRWLAVASVAISMTVNALVTGLITFKIFNMYREVKSTSDDQTLGATCGNKIRTVIFILIESGIVLFSIQFSRIVVRMVLTDSANKAFVIIRSIHQMLNGITPTIILVRVSMGLSFHDQESMIECTVGSSMSFAANNPNSVLEMGDVDIVNIGDDISIRLSDDIQIVDR